LVSAHVQINGFNLKLRLVSSSFTRMLVNKTTRSSFTESEQTTLDHFALRYQSEILMIVDSIAQYDTLSNGKIFCHITFPHSDPFKM
jgi:hypothetical protein